MFVFIFLVILNSFLHSNELFASQARPLTNKVLLVITDGMSSWGDYSLKLAAENAQRNNITRYAIGVNNPNSVYKPNC